MSSYQLTFTYACYVSHFTVACCYVACNASKFAVVLHVMKCQKLTGAYAPNANSHAMTRVFLLTH